MNRRNMLWAAISSIGAGLTASRINAAQEANPSARLRIVYHLNDLDRVGFVLGTIQNHYDGGGGPDYLTIALVVHGPALRAFHLASSNPDISGRHGRLSKAGLDVAACSNSMKAQGVTLADLQPGFVEASRGGVVRIAELQSLGYLYLRP